MYPMKNKALILLMLGLLPGGFDTFARPLAAPTYNYVVIGAFAIESNAVDHVAAARKLSYKAEFAINPNRHLYYVYVMRTEDARAAFEEANKVRKATPYFDTWVYNGLLGIAPAAPPEVVGVSAEKQTPEKIVTTTPSIEPAKARDSVSTPAAAVPNLPKAEADEKNFWFRIFSSEGDIDGDIDLIDVEKAKKVGSYKGNQHIVIPAVNKSGNISLVCEVFGYRKLQKDLNYNQPQDSPGAVVDSGEVKVPFELVRLQKGDFGVMYNVYFFKDAAVMRPESKYEVISLTNMMKGNMKYKIRIHGHTNGNASGKVISMGDSKNFFSLTNTKEGFGSANKLSQKRAEVIRDFLISEGIDGKRMEIKAWGGKHPLYDKMSPQAQANVRVEIEILEDK
jgi:outer membrane protein OmpA-like peptidoglycan-associated protein